MTRNRPNDRPTGDDMSYGHHPDPLTDAQVELDRLEGLLYNARAGLERALDLRVASPAGQAVKRDVRWALEHSRLGRGTQVSA